MSPQMVTQFSKQKTFQGLINSALWTGVCGHSANIGAAVSFERSSPPSLVARNRMSNCTYKFHTSYDGHKALCPVCKARKEKLISQKAVATYETTVALLKIANVRTNARN